MKKKKMEVLSDCFGVVKEIKKLNKNYSVYYSFAQKKWQIFKKGLMPQLLFVLPFSKLDRRAVWYVKKMQQQNAREVFKEIEAHNEKLEKQNLQNVQEQAHEQLHDIMRYCGAGNKNFKANDSFKTKWF